jgi:hypothetical protein
VSFTELAGYAAAFLVFSTFYMKTMIPLRCLAIASNVAFITYGSLGHLRPVLFLHLVLLPLNVLRLVQARRLIAALKEASHGDLSFESMVPYMKRERFGPGQVIFRRGDQADKLYLLRSGGIALTELGRSITAPGAVVGEIGIFSRSKKRTATAVAEGDTEALSLADDKVLQLYFQNPKFGFNLLRLIMNRLIQGGVPESTRQGDFKDEGRTT